jgi:hypothetical protein
MEAEALPWLSRSSFRARASPAVGVVLLLAIAHLLLPLNAGLYQDDWLIVPPLAAGEPDALSFLDDAGHPIFHLYYRLVWLIGGSAVGFKVAAWLAVLVGGWLTYRIGPAMFGLSRDEAFWLAVLAWTYPAYMLWPVITTSAYVVSLMLFLAAWHLVLSRETAPGLVRRASADVLFLLSFGLNALLVLFYLFAALFCLADGAGLGESSSRGIRGRVALFLARWPELVALPPAYWFWLHWRYPRRVGYSVHYSFKWLDASAWQTGLENFFVYGVQQPAMHLVKATIKEPRTLLLTAVALCIVAMVARLCTTSDDAKAAPRAWTPILAGITIALMAMLPYLLIGIAPGLHYYESRHLLLAGLPLALVLIGVLRVIGCYWEAWRVRHALLVLIAGASVSVLMQNYLYLEARTARLDALSRHLAGLPEAGAASIIAIDDTFYHPEGLAALNRHDYFAIFELTGMSLAIWGGRHRLVFELERELSIMDRLVSDRSALEKDLRYYWTMRTMDLSGTACRLRLERGAWRASNARVGAASLYHRFAARAARPAWLDRLVTIRFACD